MFNSSIIISYFLNPQWTRTKLEVNKRNNFAIVVFVRHRTMTLSNAFYQHTLQLRNKLPLQLIEIGLLNMNARNLFKSVYIFELSKKELNLNKN